MPTNKDDRRAYRIRFYYLRDLIINVESFILDKHNKKIYNCKCPMCFSDRGYVRYSQAFIPCRKCGQTGKKSTLKDIKRSDDFKLKISQANMKFKLKNNPHWKPMSTDAKKIARSVRTRIWQNIKNVERKSSQQLTGISWEDLKTYLESRFLPGMTWENYSKYGWHIDHIRPLSSFDLTDKVQLEQACHYSNLQPLWAKDNISKGAKHEA